MKSVVASAFLLLAALMSAAQAPDPLVSSPRAGTPALVTPGGTFRLVLNRPWTEDSTPPNAVLLSEDNTTQTLDVAPRGPWGNGTLCEVRLARETPPAAYTLRVTLGDTTAHYPRAVWVAPDPGAYYLIAHLSGPALAGNAALADALEKAARADAAFAILTGPLSNPENAPPPKACYTALCEAPLPVILAGAPQDGDTKDFGAYFSTAPWGFRYGDDGYLVTPTTDRPARGVAWPQDGGPADGLVAYWRRALVAARWAIAVTPGYRTGAWLRLDQTLLADDPVAALITGPDARAATPAVRPSPWGNTLLVSGAAPHQGGIRFIDMTAQGPRPRALAGDKPETDTAPAE